MRRGGRGSLPRTHRSGAESGTPAPDGRATSSGTAATPACCPDDVSGPTDAAASVPQRSSSVLLQSEIYQSPPDVHPNIYIYNQFLWTRRSGGALNPDAGVRRSKAPACLSHFCAFLWILERSRASEPERRRLSLIVYAQAALQPRAACFFRCRG